VQVLRLRLDRFRNFASEEIAFSAGTNLLYGANGQGKTNLLEAIYLLSYGKSFRTATARDCIRHGETSAAVWAVVEHGAVQKEMAVSITPVEKRLFLHGKPVAIDEFAGNLHALAFTSEHLGVVRGGPAERRAFLDRAILMLEPGYLRRIARYSRSLKQRNRMFASARAIGQAVDDRLVSSWDEKLAEDGARILAERRRYIAELEAALEQGTLGSEELRLRYVSNVAREVADAPSIERAFLQRLAETRAADARSGFTISGPHRDDLELFIDGRPLRDFGSAGQQRSCLLALYFAQMEIHARHHGSYPVFLIDDVEAELDTRRMQKLLDHIEGRAQTFLTTAKESLISARPGPIARFEIVSGAVRHSGAP